MKSVKLGETVIHYYCVYCSIFFGLKCLILCPTSSQLFQVPAIWAVLAETLDPGNKDVLSHCTTSKFQSLKTKKKRKKKSKNKMFDLRCQLLSQTNWYENYYFMELCLEVVVNKDVRLRKPKCSKCLFSSRTKAACTLSHFTSYIWEKIVLSCRHVYC